MVDGVTRIDLPSNHWGAEADNSASLSCFVAGPENRLVVPALERFLSGIDLQSAALLFNPLLLTGPSGSGKTHLVRGIVRRWSELLGDEYVSYLTAADFARQLHQARSEGKLGAFRESLFRLRLLVIEDLQRLPRRAFVQRELRDTVDELIDGGAVVIATSQQTMGSQHAMMALATLESGLADRLAAGLQLRLRIPAAAARRELLQLAADARRLTIDSTRLNLLAERSDGSVPQLMRALAEWELESITGKPISAVSRAPVTLKQIIAVVSRYCSLTQAAVCSSARRKSLVHARSLVVHLARILTNLSYSQIGYGLGRRDHTTIMHAQQNMKKLLTIDVEVQQSVGQLQRILTSA